MIWPNKTVIIVYPIVTSDFRDNSGGASHLKANIAVYKHLGYKVIVISRLSWKLIVFRGSTLFLNIVPGRAVGGMADHKIKPKYDYRCRFFAFAKSKINSFVSYLIYIVSFLLPVLVIHQRSNMRYIFGNKIKGIISILEINDEYISDIACDLYLSINDRGLACRSLISEWPVLSLAEFDIEHFRKRLKMTYLGGQVKLVLLGTGGLGSTSEFVDFLSEHAWLKDKCFDVDVYGEADHLVGFSANINVCGHQDVNSIDFEKYHLGIIYYDSSVYSDQRLLQGDPTKFHNYVDKSLPIITNRKIIRSRYLNMFDACFENLTDSSLIDEYVDHVLSIRSKSSVIDYSENLDKVMREVEG